MACGKCLGPIDLVLLGIGGIVGAGIFALVGTAAAGDAARPGAGPALVVSFVLTGIACGFTALCYAEFASMVPISGSAYTYAYITLGEIVAWIIGWDLVLEYAVGNVAVAVSWSGYFCEFLRGFGLEFPRWLATDLRTALATPEILDAAPRVLGVPVVFNLPAVFIVTAITCVSGRGHQGERLVQRRDGRHQAVGAGVLRGDGHVLRQAGELASLRAQRLGGHPGGGGGRVLCLHRFRCRLHGRRGVPPCPPGPAHRHPRLAGHLHRHLRGRGGRADRDDPLAGNSTRPSRFPWPCGWSTSTGRRASWPSVRSWPTPRCCWSSSWASRGFSSPWPATACCRAAWPRPIRASSTPYVATILTGLFVGVGSALASLEEMADLCNIGTLSAFVIVSSACSSCGGGSPSNGEDSGRPGCLGCPCLGVLACLWLMFGLPWMAWIRFAVWLCVGLALYAAYGYRKSRLHRCGGVKDPRSSASSVLTFWPCGVRFECVHRGGRSCPEQP